MYLIAKANQFLDNLATDKNSFKMNIKFLKTLRDEMLFNGFNAPFAGLMQQSQSEFELDESDSRDLAKQLEKMRNLANSKKFALNRVRVSLSAHRIAASIVSAGFETELLKALPYDGNYVGSLINSREFGLYAYRDVMSLLEASDSPSEPRMQVSVKYTKDGKPASTKVMVATNKNIEGRIKRVYGEDAKITSTKVFSSKPPFIRKRSARVSLSTAYALLASKHAYALVPYPPQLKEYAEVMHLHGLDVDAIIDQVDGYHKVKHELVHKGLMKEDDGVLSLGEEIARALVERRRALRETAMAKARELLALDLFRYFLLLPKREREKTSIFPGLISPAPQQLRLLEMLSTTYSIDDPVGLIEKKFEAESLRITLEGKVFGSAFFYLTTDKSLEWCRQYLFTEPEKVREGAIILAPFIECKPEKLVALDLKKVARAGRFAELVKHSGKGEAGKKG